MREHTTINKKDLFKTVNEFLKLNEGDEATEHLILGFASRLCNCSVNSFIEELNEYNKKP